MKRLSFAAMLACLMLSMVLVAGAQEKGCEYEGKTFDHRQQVWNLKGDDKCWVCYEGEWVQGMRHSENFCKGKL